MTDTMTEDRLAVLDDATAEPEPSRAEQIRARLEELRAERAQYADESLRAAEQLARSTADGTAEPHRKKLRLAAAELSQRVDEIDGAIRFLEVDHKLEVERAGKAAVESARLAMEAARSSVVDSTEELERAMIGLAPGIVPAYDRMMSARAACYQAQGSYARIVGNDREFDRAEARDLPSTLTAERAEILWPAVHALVTLAGVRLSGRPIMTEFKG